MSTENKPMSNNQLPADVESRLDAAVKRRSLSHDYASGYKEGYIAGATAVHERAQVLVDALGNAKKHIHELCMTIIRLGYTPFNPISEINEALEQWKGTGKEVGRPEHNVSIGEWITYCKNCGFPIAPINECNCIDKETLS